MPEQFSNRSARRSLKKSPLPFWRSPATLRAASLSGFRSPPVVSNSLMVSKNRSSTCSQLRSPRSPDVAIPSGRPAGLRATTSSSVAGVWSASSSLNATAMPEGDRQAAPVAASTSRHWPRRLPPREHFRPTSGPEMVAVILEPLRRELGTDGPTPGSPRRTASPPAPRGTSRRVTGTGCGAVSTSTIQPPTSPEQELGLLGVRRHPIILNQRSGDSWQCVAPSVEAHLPTSAR